MDSKRLKKMFRFRGNYSNSKRRSIQIGEKVSDHNRQDL